MQYACGEQLFNCGAAHSSTSVYEMKMCAWGCGFIKIMDMLEWHCHIKVNEISEIRFVIPCTTKLVTSSIIPSRYSFVEMSFSKITSEEQTSNEEEVVKGPADFVQTWCTEIWSIPRAPVIYGKTQQLHHCRTYPLQIYNIYTLKNIGA